MKKIKIITLPITIGVLSLGGAMLPLTSCSCNNNQYDEQHNIDNGGTINVQQNEKGKDLIYKVTLNNGKEIDSIEITINGKSTSRDNEWTFDDAQGILTIKNAKITGKVDVNITTKGSQPGEQFDVDVTNNILIEDDIILSQPKAETNHDYNTDVTSDDGLILTDSVEVFVNNDKLTSGVTWTKTSDTTGKLKINKDKIITNNLRINFITVEKNISVPLTIKNEENTEGTLKIYCNSSDDLPSRSLQYSVNGSTNWKNLNWEDQDMDWYIDETIDVPKNGYVQLKGDNSTGWGGENFTISFQLVDKDTGEADLISSVSGNIMSLLYTDFTDKKEIPTAYCFTNLFNYYGTGTGLNLKTAKNLVLPATKLTKDCYSGMFLYSPIKYAPRFLPSENIEEECYSTMFHSCEGLISSPDICAKNINEKNNSLNQMFVSCNNLKKIMLRYKGKFCEEETVPTDDPFYMWLEAASSSGKIYYNPNDTQYIPTYRNSSTIPEDWEIIRNW